MKIKKILDSIEFIKYNGPLNINIDKPISIEECSGFNNGISWCSDKNISLINNLKTKSIIIISNNINEKSLTVKNYIIVKNSRYAFKEILKLFYKKDKTSICSTSKIHKSVFLGKNINIGSNVVIEKNSIVHDNTSISHNSVIYKNTIVGKNVVIGSNCTIGNRGFGYEKNNNGINEHIPHLGNVIIEDNVEIGDNVTIDKAILGSTLISENVKIDNLTQIAHGVKIYRNVTILANVVIAGSVVIGEDSWISFSSSILNKVKIGKNCLVGVDSCVMKDIKDNHVVIGSPAKFFRLNK